MAEAIYPTWGDLRGSEHLVQFYETEEALLGSVLGYVAAGLDAGDACVVIATKPRRTRLEERLGARGFDVTAATACGQYISLDALDLLARLLVDGDVIRPARFDEIVGGLVTKATEGGRGIRVYGEMVELLANAGEYPLARSLEGLWRELQGRRPCLRLCAYSLDSFDATTLAEQLDAVYTGESRVIPAESYSGLTSSKDRLREVVLLQQKARSLEATTARRDAAEQRLQRGEERYRTIIEDMTDSYWETNLAGNFTFFNNQVLLEQRRSKEELLRLDTKHNLGHMDPENARKVGEVFRRVLFTGEPVRGVRHEMIRGDGTRYSVESNISLRRDAEGRPAGFCGITRDVTERLRAERELQQAKESAEAANLAKSEFLANMSHEIRTPMNGIIGMALLAMDTPLTAEQREYLSIVKSSSEALLSIINDILDFSKIEAGRLAIEAVDFPLRDGVAEVVKSIGPRAHEKGLELACHVAPDVPDAVVGDPGRLRQILLNLVGNAVKFTDRGEVSIDAAVDARDADGVLVHFVVADTGIGIPVEKQQQIFEPFSQADNSTTRVYGGTGLGLTISSKLVAMMGGQIWVESRPDVGSRFHFTARLGTREETPMPADEARGDEAAKTANSRRVLLVEDNLVNRRVATALLEKRGHVVVPAINGREAVAAAERERFDVILMDVQMPEMNGYEATAAIRRHEAGTGTRVPIVAMTAHAMAGDRERCLEAGMDGYLSKPFGRGELFATVEGLAPH